ncbi:MAG: ferredoxin family protein [candidate division WOR-3 bacterium]
MDYVRDKEVIKMEGFKVLIRKEWCKGCFLCLQICPKKVFTRGEGKVPEVKDQDKCSGCLLCELLCPDLAITVEGRCPRE